MKKALFGILFAIGVVGYTKLVWQSGFDQGADVSLCVVESMIASEGDVVSLTDSETCDRAKAYESNPLWQLRRRDGMESQEVQETAPLNEKGVVSNIT